MGEDTASGYFTRRGKYETPCVALYHLEIHTRSEQDDPLHE